LTDDHLYLGTTEQRFLIEADNLSHASQTGTQRACVYFVMEPEGFEQSAILGGEVGIGYLESGYLGLGICLYWTNWALRINIFGTSSYN